MDELAAKIQSVLFDATRRLAITRMKSGNDDGLMEVETDLKRVRVMFQTYRDKAESLQDDGR